MIVCGSQDVALSEMMRCIKPFLHVCTVDCSFPRRVTRPKSSKGSSQHVHELRVRITLACVVAMLGRKSKPGDGDLSDEPGVLSRLAAAESKLTNTAKQLEDANAKLASMCVRCHALFSRNFSS